MKIHIIHIIIGIVALCSSVHASNNDSMVINSKDLDSILISINDEELDQWPFVYSSGVSSAFPSAEKRLQQSDFRTTCGSLLEGLSTMCSHDVVSVSNTIHDVEILIKWRNLLYASPSYENLLLAEAVNRLLVVKLADKKLVEDVESRAVTIRLIHEARGIRIPLASWRIVVDQEYHNNGFGKIAENTFIEPSVSMEICKEIWVEMGRRDDMLAPAYSSHASLFDLHNKTDMPLLFHRYVATDAYMRKLEMVYKYLNEVPFANTQDKLEKVEKKFPIMLHTKYSMTPKGLQTSRIRIKPEPDWSVEEVVRNDPFSALQVSALMRAIDSNKLLEIIPFFSTYADLSMW